MGREPNMLFNILPGNCHNQDIPSFVHNYSCDVRIFTTRSHLYHKIYTLSTKFRYVGQTLDFYGNVDLSVELIFSI